jgi:hypothetical protein
MSVLTEEEWGERFVPILKQDEDCLLLDGSNADERAFLDAVGNNRIWTQVEADDAIEYVPGRWRVNAIGYIVTMIPWAEDEADLTVMIDLHMDGEASDRASGDSDKDGGENE